jgi:hypothetical protein
MMPNAPTLNGQAGSLNNVLNACLVTGFGETTITSLEVVDNVATVTLAAHGLEEDTVIELSGATPEDLNGQHKVSAVTLDTLSFNIELANVTASGAIGMKLASAGWSNPFTSGNIRVYRSTDIESSQMYLRVNDSTAQNARASGFVSMTSATDGLEEFPLPVHLAGGVWWPNANSTATTPRPWVVIADSRTFYVWVNTHTSNIWTDGFLYGFGDFDSVKPGDAYSCFISGASTNLSNSGNTTDQSLGYTWVFGTTFSTQYVPKSFTAIGQAQQTGRKPESYSTSNGHSGSSSSVPYPNPADNSLLLSRTLLTEVQPFTIRGVFPGLLWCPQTLGTGTFITLAKINGQRALSGRKLLAINNNGGPASTQVTSVTSFIDITGPWR